MAIISLAVVIISLIIYLGGANNRDGHEGLCHGGDHMTATRAYAAVVGTGHEGLCYGGDHMTATRAYATVVVRDGHEGLCGGGHMAAMRAYATVETT
jgi:hypothetical protein